MTTVRYALDEFIHDITSLVASESERAALFDKGSSYLERLAANPGAIPACLLAVGRVEAESRQLCAASRAGAAGDHCGVGARGAGGTARSPHLGNDRCARQRHPGGAVPAGGRP